MCLDRVCRRKANENPRKVRNRIDNARASGVKSIVEFLNDCGRCDRHMLLGEGVTVF